MIQKAGNSFQARSWTTPCRAPAMFRPSPSQPTTCLRRPTHWASRARVRPAPSARRPLSSTLSSTPSTLVLDCATLICQRRRAVYGKCSMEFESLSRKRSPRISTGHAQDTDNSSKCKPLILLALPRGLHQSRKFNHLKTSGTSDPSTQSLCILSRGSHHGHRLRPVRTDSMAAEFSRSVIVTSIRPG